MRGATATVFVTGRMTHFFFLGGQGTYSDIQAQYVCAFIPGALR